MYSLELPVIFKVLRQVSLLLNSGVHIADGLCDFVAPSSTHQVLSGANLPWSLSCMDELHAVTSEQHYLLWPLARGGTPGCC